MTQGPSPRTAPQVRTIRAPNPSALTGTGTNTYILGTGEVAVIDPGPADDSHLAAILQALGPHERITHILVTHPHRDHSALALRLSQAVSAPVAAFGTATEGRSAAMSALSQAGFPDGGEGLDRSFRPDIRLADGDSLAAGGLSVQAIHTPGHLGSHLCFAAGDILFSGDHVMGWSTSVIAPPDGDMTDYMASLSRLATRPWARFYPGHGAAVDDPAARLSGLIRHRQDRTAQILAALHAAPADAPTLATRIYTGLPAALLPAATANTLAHLVDLAQKGLVEPARPTHPATLFHAT